MRSFDILQPSPPASKIRPSRSSKRRALVLLVVHLLIAAHITHWLVTGRSVTPVEPSEAMAFSSSGIVNAGLIFFVAMALLTAVFGRFFCGWACHLVALQDLSSALLAKIGVRPQPLRSRVLLLVPLFGFVYMFIVPAVQRWRSERSLAPRHLELTTEYFWQTFPGWFVGGLTFLVCGFVVIYLLGSKGFCTYACPYGALFATVDRVAPFRIRVNDDCEQCGHCTAVCTSNVRVHEEVRDFGMVVDPGCMKCMDCVSVCPKDALSYGFGPLPIAAQRKQTAEGRPASSSEPLPWSEELVLGLGFVVGYVCLRGVYGAVPLLLSLGLGACVASLALLGWRLVRREHVQLRSHQLKRNGRLQAGGRLATVLLVLLAGLLAHSGWMRWEMWQADRAYFSLRPAIESKLVALEDPELEATALSNDQQHRLDDGLEHYRNLHRFGLFDGIGPLPRRASLELLAGNHQLANELASDAHARDQRPWEMSRLLSALCLSRTDLECALEHARHAFVERPNIGAAAQVARIATASGDLRGARSVLNEAQRVLGPAADLSYAQGMVEVAEGDLSSARDRFSAALELDPAHLPALENLAGVLAASGRFVEARDLFEKAVELQPDDLESRFLLARVLLELDAFDEAEVQLKSIVEREPSAQLPRQLLTQLETRRRDSES